MQGAALTLSVFFALILTPNLLQAYCGCFLRPLPPLPPQQASEEAGRVNARLLNEASKVVIARTGEETVVTMANDYQGELKQFAMVFPIPAIPKYVRVAKSANLEDVDRLSSPTLIQHFDTDPCWVPEPASAAPFGGGDNFFGGGSADLRRFTPAKTHGVSVEASYQIGEYDIQVLTGKQSSGLVAWLNENGYEVPKEARPIFESYIKQRMKFFVAKVNLEEASKLGYTYLRPIQVAYKSKKFALPIRLGTINAKGDQDMLVYFLSKSGRVECTNYKTVLSPVDKPLPLFVKDDFSGFYQDMFAHQAQRSATVVQEFAGMLRFGTSLEKHQLIDLGCPWTEYLPSRQGASTEAFLTRLHVRYNARTFPEDLQFQFTGDRKPFRGDFTMQTPFRPAQDCAALKTYLPEIKKRWEDEVDQFHKLTGKPKAEIWKQHAEPFMKKKADVALYNRIQNLK